MIIVTQLITNIKNGVCVYGFFCITFCRITHIMEYSNVRILVYILHRAYAVIPSYAVPCNGIAKIGTEKRRFIMEFDNILSQLLRQEEDRMGAYGEETEEDAINTGKIDKTDRVMESHRRGAEMGDLPCDAPIGMTYTPMQRRNSPRYTAGEGLDRGTLWPGLELPWKNNSSVRSVSNTPLGEVQALDFALVELAMYLDTHPDDTDAIMLFGQYAKAYEEKKAAYEKAYGPLVKTSAGKGDRWNWIDNPWPWDYVDRR